MKEKRYFSTGLIFLMVFFGVFVIFVVAWKIQGKDNSFESQFPAELSLSILNKKTGEECIEILKDYGLVLPETYEKDKQLAEEAVKTIISDLNKKTLFSEAVPYNYTEMADLAKQISNIVQREVDKR